MSITSTSIPPPTDEELLAAEDPPPCLWAPEPADPVRETLARLGGRHIAGRLTDMATFGHPPLRVRYGRFHTICAESEDAFLVWFQPNGDCPASRLYVRDPLGYGIELTGEVVLPTSASNRG